MKLFVLAGGFGTRIKSVLNDVPKILAPVNQTNLLSMQISYWITQGLNDIVFLLHHKSDVIINFLQKEINQNNSNVKISWVVEDIALGTGGAIKNAIDKTNFSGDFILVNGDTWLNGNLTDLVSSNSPSIGVVEVSDTSRFGKIIFNAKNKVMAFEEKKSEFSRGWIYAGIAHLNTSLFDTYLIEEFSLEKVFFEELINTNKLLAIPLKTYFIDIGVPNDYLNFCRLNHCEIKAHD